MNGAGAITLLLQGVPAANINLDELEPRYQEAASRILAAENGHRQTAFDEWLAEQPEADANRIRQAVQAVGAGTGGGATGNSTERTDAPGKPYTLHWASEALEPQPPMEWIVTGLFPASSLTVIYGEPGCKKTWCALDAAVCVALGRDWLGHATQKVTALVVDEESGPRRMARRLGNIMRAHGAGPDTAVAYTTLEYFNLREQANIGRLRAAVVESWARLIVIDALVDIMAGADENAAKETQPILLALRHLANEVNGAVVVIHHSGKNGDYRGTSALKGAVDGMLEVQSKPKASEIRFKSDKMRDVEPLEFSALISFEPDQTILTAMTEVKDTLLLSRAKQFVVRYLHENGPSYIKEVETAADAAGSGVTAGAARQATYALAALKLAERTDGGGSGTKAVYGLTAAGQTLAGQVESGEPVG